MPEVSTVHPAALGQLRVGDADREQVADQLAEHHAAGRLTLAELEERLTTVWSARTGDELAATLVDLPVQRRTAQPAPSRRPYNLVAGLPTQLISYLAVMAGLWLIWALTGAGYPWPIWPMLGWGLGLLGCHFRAAAADPVRTPPPS
jgi:hypothetical protein